jgi:flagellar biogenesis protein FliO
MVPAPDTIDFGNSLLRMLGSLGIVLLFLFVGLYFLKRIRGISSVPLEPGVLQIKDRLQVGPGHQLLLVKVRNAEFLVGTTAQGITVAPVPVAESRPSFESCIRDVEDTVKGAEVGTSQEV